MGSENRIPDFLSPDGAYWRGGLRKHFTSAGLPDGVGLFPTCSFLLEGEVEGWAPFCLILPARRGRSANLDLPAGRMSANQGIETSCYLINMSLQQLDVYRYMQFSTKKHFPLVSEFDNRSIFYLLQHT